MRHFPSCVCCATLLSLWASLLTPSAFAQPPVTALAFTPDGMQVMVGSQRGAVVYQWPELEPVRSLETTLEAIHDVRFSNDGSLLALAGGSPGEEGVVEIWSWPAAQRMKRLVVHRDVIYQVAWHRHGKQLATASNDLQVGLIRLPSYDVQRLVGHSKGVTSVVFMGDDHLVSAGHDATIRVWDLANLRVKRTFDNHRGPIRDLSLKPHGEGLPQLASASQDRTIRIWQPTIGRLVRFVRLSAEPMAIAWTPDGRSIVAACRDGRLRRVDAVTVRVVQEAPAVEGWAFALAVDSAGQSTIVGGSQAGLVQVLHAPPSQLPK